MKSVINLMLGALLIAGSLHATAQTVITEERTTLSNSQSITVVSNDDYYGHYSELIKNEVRKKDYLNNPTKLKGLELELSSVIKNFDNEKLLIFITKLQGDLESLRKELNESTEKNALHINIAIGTALAIATLIVSPSIQYNFRYHGMTGLLKKSAPYLAGTGVIVGFLVNWNHEDTNKKIQEVNSQVDSIIVTLNALKESVLNTKDAESF